MTDSSIIGQLYQRKMFRIGAGYLAVAWLLWQVVANTCPTFECSNESQRAIFWLLLGGLPITLAVAWVNWKTAIIVGVAFIAGAGVAVMVTGSQPIPVVPIVEEVERERLPNSVAVLPLDNLSLDPEDAFFASGIHDTILNELANIRDMNVIARTTMLGYAGTDKSISQIATELNVETVLEGSVQYANNRVRITAQLIDPVTDAHLWSQIYDRDFDDIFAIQSDIAKRIATALEAQITETEQLAVDRPLTSSPEAYALYLKARSLPLGGLWGNANAESILGLLDGAIEMDSEFALAYVGKANIYGSRQARLILVASGALESSERGVVLADQFLDQALTLNPDLASAHALRANWLRESNWGQGQQLYKHALELSPNDPDIIEDYSLFLTYSGQFAEGIRLAERAVETNPASAIYLLAVVHHYAGNNDIAFDLMSQVIERYPVESAGHTYLGFIEVARENYSEALEQLRLGERLLDGAVPGFGIISEVAYSYARAGSLEDAERYFSQSGEQTGSYLAYMQLARGNEDAALLLLKNIADASPAPENGPVHRGPNLARIVWNTLNDPILDQPEFVEVRSRLGFQD